QVELGQEPRGRRERARESKREEEA
ncbi:hypothetical protein A2U01_0111382, partial [Trifolium medium]|nr:hypothetical protein [Trifolium medium]